MTATMPRPGSVVTVRSTPPPRTIPTDTGLWFAVGTTDRGPLKPVLIQSLTDFVNIYGARQTYSVLYDAIEMFFREGGSRAYISRVVGPAPVLASVNLLDGVAATSLVVKAKGPGAYANTLRVTVTIVTGGYTLTISDSVLGTLEVSPTLADQASAVAWSQTSQCVDITLGASALIPVAIVNAPLAGGADDRVNITDAQWANALNLFTRDLGPGQVSAPGRTTAAGHTQVLTHASNNNRTALLDGPDTATVATVTAAAAAQRGAIDRFGALFAPWVVAPGILPGTTRIVPPSAFVAAKIGRSDGSGNSPNKPAAGNGIQGSAQWAIGLSQNPYDSGSGIDVTRDSMYSSSVNLIVFRYGAVQVFGWRTLTDPNGANQDWVNLGNARLAMAITAKAQAIAENYILDEIDGRGLTFAAFNGDLVGMMTIYYNLGSLYGNSPEAAFTVDTGPAVNTPATIANRELHAAIGVRMAQDAELVVIEVAKVPVTQSL